MSDVNVQQTVGELVVQRPSRSRVFEQHGIDYCCGGGVSLEEACRKNNVNVDTILEELKSADSKPDTATPDYNAMPLGQLIDHIMTTHHDYLRQELPRLVGLTAKVADAHSDSPAASQLKELAAVFAGLTEELQNHMMKEERMLFPFIAQMETERVAGGPFGSVANPISVMEAEHDSAGNALDRIKELTDSYTLPEWGCNSYRAMLDGLRELELDLHQHIHKENNILFPRAIALESSLQVRAN